MISVHETEKLSLQQIEQFLLAAKEVRFEASQREEIYGWVERLLCQQEYMGQGRRARGLLRRYLGKMTGLSRAQLTRLVGRYLATGRVRIKTSHRHRFPTRYTRADIELLAQVDEAHQTLSGPASRRIFERRVWPLRQARVPALGRHLQRASVQLTPHPALSPAPQELPKNAAQPSGHWRAPPSRSARAPQVSAGEYGAPRRRLVSATINFNTQRARCNLASEIEAAKVAIQHARQSSYESALGQESDPGPKRFE